MKMREIDLSPFVSDWLKNQGYSVYSEIDVTGPIDHVGVRWADNDIICVEMKLSCTRHLFVQAIRRQLITTKVYIAVATKPRKTSIELAKQYGLGILIEGTEILAPNSKEQVYYHYQNKLLRLCKQLGEGGIGGKPNTKGEGPAIKVQSLIAEYRKNNPTASWKELFANVPNHYASPNSMYGAMKQLKEWQDYRNRQENVQ